MADAPDLSTCDNVGLPLFREGKNPNPRISQAAAQGRFPHESCVSARRCVTAPDLAAAHRIFARSTPPFPGTMPDPWKRSCEGAVAILLFLECLAITSMAQSCSRSLTFSNRTSMTFTTCVNLPSQQASLAWSYNASGNTLAVVFSGVAPSSSGWVGWGINFGARPVMIGTNALVAFQAGNGSNLLDYKLTEETQALRPLTCSPIDLVVLDRAVVIQERNMRLYALIQLRPNQTRLNHVWNRGSSVINFSPQQHALGTNDLNGRGVFDITSGALLSSRPLHQKLKEAHGLINAIGWGILLPLGAMFARYLRPFHDSAWFCLHVPFQVNGYILGVIGWAIGLRLGSYSVGVVYHKHRNIGITLFVFGTLQVLSLILRPGLDHKARPYWKVYHRTIGYLTLLLAIVNIYKGLDILEPHNKWRRAYTGILVVLAVISLLLEVATWMVHLKRRKAEKAAKPIATNGRHDGIEI
ncbi:cytochrome b561 and DOMON domain-containing protein At5g35735 [Selaginella moellendorffii]|uniref:cytochrome b561 and DOMON domain-containing protein At5g35735 n=1 Tax=Selaginella moellendorffii TaxID=88036 RepID=UPI000D1CBAA8|nr:cytochrome b561 and DOMON domain-containing protein At5g35735 [Selaginella moellendorffii]|eukprot:XP_024527920.1 cytochrome b561 and DOMON domain-containing protein At5g35735 [Selaginella moellendorffii]